MIMGSVCLRRERAAPNSLNSISSNTTCSGSTDINSTIDNPDLVPLNHNTVNERTQQFSLTEWLFWENGCKSHTSHLLIEVYQGFIWQLERLNSLEDSVPVTAVNVRHETVDTVHSVQRDRGLLLEGGQSPLKIIFLQILHYQTYHAVEKEFKPMESMYAMKRILQRLEFWPQTASARTELTAGCSSMLTCSSFSTSAP